MWKKISISPNDYRELITQLTEFYAFQLKNAENFLKQDNPAVDCLDKLISAIKYQSQLMGHEVWIIISQPLYKELIVILDLIVKFKIKNAEKLGVELHQCKSLNLLNDLVKNIKFRTAMLNTYSTGY
jgi:hypothetical protein